MRQPDLFQLKKPFPMRGETSSRFKMTFAVGSVASGGGMKLETWEGDKVANQSPASPVL